MKIDHEAFLRAYIVAALWASTDEHGEPLDAVFSPDDVAPKCHAAMRASCDDFINANEADLLEYCARMVDEYGERMKDGEFGVEGQAGHDFWLTRNGHGAGFWDRGLGDLGKRLSDAAEVYGAVDLYAGDDGWIYGETE